ncbi:MAG: hypothetical protein R3B69_04340 [Candidatus Paceibacterota bacterium]
MVTLDSAKVALPDYFEELNTGYRYLYTGYGQSAPGLYIKEEIQDGKFTIAGGPPNARVSWQVTGIRQDPYILANPIVNEVEKGPDELVDKGGICVSRVLRLQRDRSAGLELGGVNSFRKLRRIAIRTLKAHTTPSRITRVTTKVITSRTTKLIIRVRTILRSPLTSLLMRRLISLVR